MTTTPKLIIPNGVLLANDTAFLYEPLSYVPMAKVVARVVPNHPPLMEIANLLQQVVPHCFLELAGRNIAKRASSELKAFKAELANLSDRLADLPRKAKAAIGIAMAWNNEIASALILVAEPLAEPPYGALAQEIEMLRITLKRLHDVIQPDLDAAPSKPRRTAETHIDEFLKVLKTVWEQQTNSPPDSPRHHGITDEFVGDFLDFAWAAVELARKLPNSEKLWLPHSKNALGKRLAGKNRAKSQ
jgi:hypothetical protein